MQLGLRGKRALVLASSRGLGYACALGLAREGCDLVICSRDQARIETAAAAIRRETGARVHGMAADVSDGSQAASLVDASVERHGGLEIVVHNAGGPPSGASIAITDPQWQQAFEANLMSFVRLARVAVPPMTATGYGRIIAIASTSIKQPIPHLILSNALRTGVLGAAKTLSRELAPAGILVNVIAPGRLATDASTRLTTRGRRQPACPWSKYGGSHSRPSHWGGWAARTSSPTWWSSWPRRPRVTSPARRFRWMAAWSRPCSRRGDYLAFFRKGSALTVG